MDGVAIDVDGQAAAQVGKGEVAGRLPAPVAEKWQKIPERGGDMQMLLEQVAKQEIL